MLESLLSYSMPRCVWITGPENPPLMSSSQQNMTAAACAVIDAVWSEHVYCRSPPFLLTANNSYESDIFISDCSDLNRCSVTTICGSWLSNMAGKQNAAVRASTAQQEIIEKRCSSHMLQQSIRQDPQASGKLFKLKLHFSGAALGSVRMKFCTYQTLT